MADYIVSQADIDLLRDEGMVEEDLQHSIYVAEKALDVARRTGADLDMELVGRGALFHDLGKIDSHGIDHGVVGAQKGKELGLPDEINSIMAGHIRGGMTSDEAKAEGLPIKDYTLTRLEEKIIVYADRLVDIVHDGYVEIKEEMEAETRFEEILDAVIKYRKDDIVMARYMGYHTEIQGLISKNKR